MNMNIRGRASVGHPVDIASGAVFTIWHDFLLPGTLPLLWRRHYATNSAADSWLGSGWTAPFFMTLQARPEGFLLTEENGATILFEVPASPLHVGERILNLYADMELWRQPNGYTIVHWHHGSADLKIVQFAEAADGSYRLAALENAAGHRISIGYDAQGRPENIVQELEQRRVQLEYGRNGLLSAVLFVSEDGAAISLAKYEYDANRRLVSARNAADAVCLYVYDEQGRLIRERNPLGSNFHFNYDSVGRCVSASGDRGYMSRSLSYQVAGRIVHVTDSLGHVTQFYLNPAGQVIQEISQMGVPETTEYDGYGRIIREINPDGTGKSYAYDSEGNRSSVMFEDGTAVSMRYNPAHFLTAYTDASGATWSMEHDALNQLSAVTNPLGNRFSCRRDERGLIVETRTPLGRRTNRRYGPGLRWWEVSDQISLRIRVEYDQRGQPVAIDDAAGRRFTAVYDEVGRLVRREDALGRTWRWEYNAIDEVTKRDQPSGFIETFEYDPFGNVIAYYNDLGVMRLEYDSEGRLTAVVNRLGERLEREYDAGGRVTCERAFDGREEHYEWNIRGRLARVIRSDGRKVDYTYGAAGQATGINSSDGMRVGFTYDPRGWIVGATAPGSELAFEIDAAGRIVAEVQNGHRVSLEYDADNFCIRRHLLDSEMLTRFDARGRLVNIADSAGPFQTLRWNEVDQLTERVAAGGLSERSTYQRDDSLLQQEVTSGGGIRVRRRYQYDEAGNITLLDDLHAGRMNFAYDQAGRLTEASARGGYREFYRYDAMSSITETHRGPRALGPGGRTLEDAGTRYAYDTAGCIVEGADPVDGTRCYAYNARGQLIRATLLDGTVAEYTYDALRRRCRRTVGERTTEYIYVGSQLAAEHDSTSGDRLFLSQNWCLFAEWVQGKRRFPVLDRSGMVREVFDQRGNPVWTGRFESYGRVLEQRGGLADRHRLPGQFSDSVTGLHDNFYRTYDPRLGAYLSPDPVGLLGGANFFGYPRNPFIWYDPLGLVCPPHTAEAEMDQHYTNQKYDKISDPNKSLHANGIDGVYKAQAGHGPPEFIIAEAKSTNKPTAPLGQTKLSGQQMSDQWINSAIGGHGGDNRLTKSVGSTDANNIGAAAAPGGGGVNKEVYHAPGGNNGSVVSSKPYGGAGSMTSTY